MGGYTRPDQRVATRYSVYSSENRCLHRVDHGAVQKLQVHGVHHSSQIAVIARDGCVRTEIDLCAVRENWGKHHVFNIVYARETARLGEDLELRSGERRRWGSSKVRRRDVVQRRKEVEDASRVKQEFAPHILTEIEDGVGGVGSDMKYADDVSQEQHLLAQVAFLWIFRSRTGSL